MLSGVQSPNFRSIGIWHEAGREAASISGRQIL